MQFLSWIRSPRRHCSRRTRLQVELLESRLTPANLPPVAPVITEPTVDGVEVSPFDVHMVVGPFSDPNLGDAHLATDWEIWTTTATPE